MGLTAICLSIAQVQPSTFKEQKSEPEQLLLLDHADPTLSYQAVYPFGPALLRSQIVVAGSRSSFDKVCWIFSGIEVAQNPLTFAGGSQQYSVWPEGGVTTVLRLAFGGRSLPHVPYPSGRAVDVKADSCRREPHAKRQQTLRWMNANKTLNAPLESLVGQALILRFKFQVSGVCIR